MPLILGRLVNLAGGALVIDLANCSARVGGGHASIREQSYFPGIATGRGAHLAMMGRLFPFIYHERCGLVRTRDHAGESEWRTMRSRRAGTIDTPEGIESVARMPRVTDF